MICAECLDQYGGEERRCPGTCEYVGYCELQDDRKRERTNEPRYRYGRQGGYSVDAHSNANNGLIFK
jgi:hypothetical protein